MQNLVARSGAGFFSLPAKKLRGEGVKPSPGPARVKRVLFTFES